MQIDRTLSTTDNLTKMVNEKAVFKYKPGDLKKTGTLTAIAPAAGNGMNNTELTILPADNSFAAGSVNIRYTRTTIANNRPGAGGLIFTNNADTHASIHAKICDLYQLLPEEVQFVDPAAPPPGGFQAMYNVSPVALSRLYLPGAVVITARNQDKFVEADPSYFFGATTGEEEGRATYSVIPQTTPGFTAIDVQLSNWSSALFTDKQNFFRMLNRLVNRPNLFNESNVTISEPVQGQAPALSAGFYEAYVDFDPVADGLLSTPGRLYFARKMLSAVSAVPASIFNNHEDSRGRQLFEYKEYPLDRITFGAYQSANPNYQYFTVNNSYIWHPYSNSRCLMSL